MNDYSQDAATRLDRNLDRTRIEALLLSLSQPSQNDDPARVSERWMELEHELARHLAREEMQVFTRLAKQFPGTIERLREQHRTIRQLMCREGVCSRLNARSPALAAELAELLGSHRAFKESILYPLARSAALAEPPDDATD